MLTLYRGTTKEFYDNSVRKHGNYTHKISLFVKMIVNLTNFRLFNDTPYPRIHFSTLPSSAIVHAIIHATNYGATPLLMQANYEELSNRGVKLDKLTDTCYLVTGEIPQDSCRTVDLVDLGKAWRLNDLLHESLEIAVDEEKTLVDFLENERLTLK